MNIAFFNYLPLEQGGGTARFFKDIAVGLKDTYRELDISIVTFDKKLAAKINALYSVYFQRDLNLELSSTRENLKNTLAKKGITYVQVESLAVLRYSLSQFDVVYSKNDIVEAFILKFLVGTNYLKKVIFGFHTPIYYEIRPNWQAKLHNFMYGSFFYKYLLQGASKFHVLNRFDEKLLTLRFKEKIIKRIYNPFDFQVWQKTAKQLKKTSAKKEKLNLLWIGRLTKEKGVDDLLRLMHKLNSFTFQQKIHWQIAGVGEYEKEIKMLSRRYTNISYLGYLDSKSLSNVYIGSDMLLSTSKWETFPYTFVEAQTFGLPIISYNIHGCNEIVKDSINGYLVNSFEELKDKLVSLSEQKKILKKNIIKNNIREMINNEQIYKEFYELFIKK